MLITVITINYNNLEGLRKTMKSVLEQTYGHIEYIVIDGGSTDGSKEFILECKENLTYWVSEMDNGIYNAMNKGIKHSSGNYLLFLNSGDILKSSNILKKIDPECFNTDIVYGDIKIVSNGKFNVYNYPDELRFSFLFKKSLPHPATFIKASLFKKVGLYDETLKIAADLKFFLVAILKYGVSYKHIKEVISVFYKDGVSSLEKNQTLIENERKSILQDDFKLFYKDYFELREFKDAISALRKSHWIKLLIKMKLVNKF